MSGVDAKRVKTETMPDTDKDERPAREDFYDGSGGPEAFNQWKQKMMLMSGGKWAGKTARQKADLIVERCTGLAVGNLMKTVTFDTAGDVVSPYVSPKIVFDELSKYVGGGMNKAQVIAALRGIRQGTRSLDDYNQDFNRVASQAALDQEDLVGHYIGGLDWTISTLVSVNTYDTIADAMGAAQRTRPLRRPTEQRRSENPRGRGGGSRGRGRGGRFGARGTDANTDGARGGQAMSRNGRPITCWECNKPGHFAAECPDNKGKGKARGADFDNGGGAPPGYDQGQSQYGPPIGGDAGRRARVYAPSNSSFDITDYNIEHRQ
jgi:hypothetical protein